MYCAIVVCICTRVIVVLSLCANVFVSAARSFFFFSTGTKNSFYVCGGGFFLSLTKNSSAGRKAHKTFFRSPHSFVWFGTLFTLRLSLSFRSSSRRQQRDDLFSRSSRLALLRSAQNVSSFSRGKRWKDYTLFARQKKKAPSSSVVVVVVWSLFFFITTYELYSRGLLGLLLFCSFIAFSWFKPSSRRRREESSSLVVPSSLFHSHALSFITLKKQAPSWSVDRSLLQTEDTQFIFVHFLNKVKKRIIKRNVL